LELVLKRFPERMELIELCYAQMAAFREICEDYVEVERAWRTALTTPAHPATGELRLLLVNLEEELVRALDAHSMLRAVD
jgi:hypothetical protein